MVGDRIEALPETRELMKVSGWLARRGWSEAGSGNISIRFDHVPDELDEAHPVATRPLPLLADRLGGCYLLITSTGSRARDIENELEPGAGLFHIPRGGESMSCVWGNSETTSELAAHIAIHQMLVEARPRDRAVLHTHPANLIALTHLPAMQNSRSLSDALLGMQSEAHVRFPDGLRYVPYSTAGSVELGPWSAEALKRSRVVIWHMHGAASTGESLSDALDNLEYVDKMAEIYWLLRSAGEKPSGMHHRDIESALKHFGLWQRHLESKSMPERHQKH
jgi:rhamnulose-1-phosphate aldolase